MKKLMMLFAAMCMLCLGAMAQDSMSTDSSKTDSAKTSTKADKKAAKTEKAAKETTVAGIITDPMCAKSGDKKKMADSDCAKKCAADGKYAFVSDKDSKVWMIENPDEVKGHEGHHVKLTGHADASANTFHVTKVTMMASKGEKKAKEDKKS